MKNRMETRNIWLWILRLFGVRRQPKRWHVSQLTRWLLGWHRGGRLCQRPNCQDVQEGGEKTGAVGYDLVGKDGASWLVSMSTTGTQPTGQPTADCAGGEVPALLSSEAHNALVRRLIAEYRTLPGGAHWRLVTMQKDFADLVRMRFFVAVWDGRVIAYFPADRVPEKYAGLVVSLERLEGLHREELRKSAARWN